ncbi:hypothetical protein GH5_00786 [Leishmania sp. Ghana 2012 LV757]|uniref:hypothetical protein n=1 Tax=Leishmania sp. Ghana 2012 LV757 TaxID=2803181 RepID=UPI001B7881CF|nr:hypothetical protein GH5_00786 [Leishmania sp. Ghana 2012 LV757]
MTSLDYAEKYRELGGLLRRYCDRKKRQTNSLQQQLNEEVSANVNLRKYIAFLEGRIQAGGESVMQSSRLLGDKKKGGNDALVERERCLHALAAQLESQLRMVHRREKKCAEFEAALKEREQQHLLDVNSFRKSKALFEAGLAASKKTVMSELQLSRDAGKYSSEPLDDFPSTNQLMQMQGCVFDHMTRCKEGILFFGRDECAARAFLLADEREERSSILSSFFREAAAHLRRHLSEQHVRDTQLHNAEDLLRLQEIDLVCRVRKETDLQQDSYAHVEMQRKVLEIQCKGVLRTVGDVLESLPDLDVEAVMTELENKIERVLQLQSANVSIGYPTHKAAGIS